MAHSRIRNPEAARRRILDAAGEAFARHGFAGARVDRIAAAAGLNKRMLYHYFGDKDGLVRAVLDHHLSGMGPRHRFAPRSARLLLWALLDPHTAHTGWQHLRAARQGDGRLLLDSLLQALGAPAAGATGKPRVRLKHRPAAVDS